MDNLKYYTGSLAHDYDLFMPRQTKVKDNVVKIDKIEKKNKIRERAKAKKAVNAKFSAIAVTVFLLCLIAASLYLRAEITVYDSKIDTAKAEYEELLSERTRLSVAYESKLSYGNLEEESKAMGMQKATNNQIVYIYTDNAVTNNGIVDTVQYDNQE